MCQSRGLVLTALLTLTPLMTDSFLIMSPLLATNKLISFATSKGDLHVHLRCLVMSNNVLVSERFSALNLDQSSVINGTYTMITQHNFSSNLSPYFSIKVSNDHIKVSCPCAQSKVSYNIHVISDNSAMGGRQISFRSLSSCIVIVELQYPMVVFLDTLEILSNLCSEATMIAPVAWHSFAAGHQRQQVKACINVWLKAALQSQQALSDRYLYALTIWFNLSAMTHLDYCSI